MAAGLMSNYYGGPNPLAAGVSSFADSFLGAYKTIGGMGQRDREIAIQEAYRKAQEEEMKQNALVRQAQIANLNSEVQKRDFERGREADMLTAMQNIPQSKYLSGLMQMGDPTAGISQEENAARSASPQFAPTIADKLGVMANYDPKGALKIEAALVSQMGKQEQKINPILSELIKAAQNGTIGDAGKAILERAGYGDMFKAKEDKPKEPSSDFSNFRNSIEKAPGESDTAFNKRVSDAWESRQIRMTGNKAEASAKGQQNAQQGLSLDDQTINSYAQYVMTRGEFPPEFSRLFRLPLVQRDAITRVQKILEESGYDGAERAVQSAAFKAGQQSLSFQEKQLGSMRGFVANIDEQIKRVGEIMPDIKSRVGVRALDVPIRELKTRFIGSGQERVLESYLMEISREIGKLSTGSQASVAELSVEAQKKWDMIHDPNLTLNELNKILTATQDQASMRIGTQAKAVDEQIKTLGLRRQGVQTPGAITVKAEPRKAGESIADYIKRTGGK